MNYNEICEFTPYFSRQHRDFIKIMIKYKEFKQLIVSTKPTLLSNPRMISQVQAQRGGNLKSQPHLSIHPKKSEEEDSIGVLTIPNDLKRDRRG